MTAQKDLLNIILIQSDEKNASPVLPERRKKDNFQFFGLRSFVLRERKKTTTAARISLQTV